MIFATSIATCSKLKELPALNTFVTVFASLLHIHYPWYILLLCFTFTQQAFKSIDSIEVIIFLDSSKIEIDSFEINSYTNHVV